MAAPTRRTLIAAGAIATGAGLALSDCSAPDVPPADPRLLDDQSRLNATRVAAKVSLGASTAAVELARARDKGLPVSVGGARHSMGGQALPPRQGLAADVSGSAVAIDAAAHRYSVSAGSRWRDVLAALDPHGLSPAITQSNNDFSIGGSVSVNAHGWAVPRGPVADSVRRLTLMTANGEIIDCSPDENAGLFGLVLGGYGLFGILLDVELEAVPNRLLERSRLQLDASAFSARFATAVHEAGVELAYGRLSLDRSRFLKDASLVTHRRAAGSVEALSVSGKLDETARRIFRAQTGSDLGKRFRWWAEMNLTPDGGMATRNSLMNVPVASFAGHDRRRTDILHEYFVPPVALNDFLAECRRIIPASRQDLLNVTLRWLEADRRSVLAFAPEPRIALVMLFSQQISAADEADMQALTRRLIDAALAVGGSFYLPYRLHARPDQLLKAYPRLPEFVAAKRRFDPELRFRNHMWDRWFAAI